MRKEKGQYGYIQYKKIYQLLMTLGCLILVMGILFVGLMYYKTISNIMTVIAVVIVIPAAKFGVGYIVLIPYKSADESLYKEVRSDKYTLMSDLVITSEQKIMGVTFAAIKAKRVYCFISHKKTNVAGTEKYLKEILNSEFQGVAVKAFSDYEKFKNAVSGLEELESDAKDKRIGELLCIYSM